MAAYPICVIRRFKDEDQQAIQTIVTEATMEQVGNFFWGALFSEVLPQIAVIFFALCYILLGVPFKFCVIAVPLVVVMLYLFVWIGHYVKANELTNDLQNIASNYMKDPFTCFFVAEVYGKSGEAELASLMNKVKKVEYDFYTEKEMEIKNVNVNKLSKITVGTIAITRSLHHAQRAWLRRMAVKTEYRRRHIGYHLLKEALKFCEERKYTGIDLVTTECHSEARQLYHREGFKEVGTVQKSYLGFGANQVLYRMYRPINEPATELTEPIVEIEKDK